jgi:segregation and condensation protein A
MRFQVDLDVYRGPLDLLVYLVRRQELDVLTIHVALLAQQYFEHLDSANPVDVDAVADFLDIASTLVEMKSRLVLPGEEEVEEEIDGSRNELVRRLLEFKVYREAASMLNEQGRDWRRRFPRIARDLPERKQAPDSQPIGDVELWDLVSAFARIVQDKRRADHPENILYDDTPIHVFMQRIYGRIVVEGKLVFSAMFDDTAHRSTLVGMFLALLELLRHGAARASQGELFEDIWIEPGPKPLPKLDNLIFEYESNSGATGDSPLAA